MTDDEEKGEIIVKAPSKPVVSPEKKAERATEKSLEEERFDILQISNTVGAYFGVAIVFVGFLLLFLFAYIGTTGQAELILLSSQAPTLGLILWVFVGLLNVITGLLLIETEG